MLKTARCCACQRTCELTLQVVTGSRRRSGSAPFIALTCTVLLSPGGRSRWQTAFCWSQELACSVKHKVFCSIVLRSPAHVCHPETILSASLDVSALAVMENPHTLSQGSYWGVYLSTVNSTIVQRIALLLPAKPSTSVPGHILEQSALYTHPSQTSAPKIALFYGPQAGQHAASRERSFFSKCGRSSEIKQGGNQQWLHLPGVLCCDSTKKLDSSFQLCLRKDERRSYVSLTCSEWWLHLDLCLIW